MIAITGGGTGGHLVIAKVVKEELNKRGIKPIYIGSIQGQDRTWFENDDGFSQTYFLQSKGVVNQKGLQKIFSLLGILRQTLTCQSIFKKHGITQVFSVGGYAAAPASLAALLFQKPLYIHEQNAIKGTLNTLLKPFAHTFFSSYDKEATFTDYPVNEAFFKLRRNRTKLHTIIFLGGSQGATFINTLAMNLAKDLHKKGIRIMHQTGKKEFETLKAFYKAEGIDADVFDFSDNMPSQLAKADFAISRSGASTLWELCATSLPALFIPFPYAAANHQYFNAKSLVEKGLALMEEQNTLDAQTILERIEHCDLSTISSNLHTTIQEGGSRKIIDCLLKNSK